MTRPKIKTYDIGDVARLSGAFRDTDDALLDPTVVTVTVREPDGSEDLATVVKDSTGLYHADFTITQQGDHYYRFAGTGTPGQSAEENKFVVRKRRVTT